MIRRAKRLDTIRAAMVGWGGPIADRHVRFALSAEPVDRIESLPDRLAGGTLAAALAEQG